MPDWVFWLYFLSGFLLVLGVVLVLVGRQGRVHSRLVQIGRMGQDTPFNVSEPGFGDALRSGLNRFGRAVLFEVSKRVPVVDKSSPQLRRQMVMAGFLAPEAAQFFAGARVVMALAMFIIMLTMSFTGLGPEPGAKSLLLGLLGVAGGFFLPNVWLGQRARKRREAINRALPDFVDLLIICVESGQGLDQAMNRVARELETAHPVFSPEIHIMNWELRAGKPRANSLRNLYARTGVEDLKTFAAMMIQADRYGVSFGQSL
ncbi:MAG: type II secretion system F family protein, partial [Nitrospinota bacterium]